MTASYAQSLKKHDQTELGVMLATIQGRLGTRDENPGDLNEAQAIAHQLNNLRTSQYLQRDLDRSG